MVDRLLRSDNSGAKIVFIYIPLFIFLFYRLGKALNLLDNNVTAAPFYLWFIALISEFLIIAIIRNIPFIFRMLKEIILHPFEGYLLGCEQIKMLIDKCGSCLPIKEFNGRFVEMVDNLHKKFGTSSNSESWNGEGAFGYYRAVERREPGDIVLFSAFLNKEQIEYKSIPEKIIYTVESDGYAAEHGSKGYRYGGADQYVSKQTLNVKNYQLRGVLRLSPHSLAGFVRLDPPLIKEDFVKQLLAKDVISAQDIAKYDALLADQIIDIVTIFVLGGMNPDKELVLLEEIKALYADLGIALQH